VRPGSVQVGDLRPVHPLAVPTGAATVRGMNSTNPKKCRCGHDLDPHQMILVILTPLPAGVMVCRPRTANAGPLGG
jgi:hypothetical protein